MKLAEIAALADGELRGDGDHEVRGLASLGSAGPRDLSFVVSAKHRAALAASAAGAMILPEALADLFEGPRVVVADPYLAYAAVSRAFDPLLGQPASVHPGAHVHPDAALGEDVHVGAGTVIEAGARIGRGTRLLGGGFVGRGASVGEDGLIHPNVVIYHDVHVGDRAVVHASATLGSDGFGFAPERGRWRKIHQLGRLVIGDDVEIGAGTCIDRGALDDTEIGDGVIIDNLVHIAHNVKVGAGTAIAGCVGIAGSTTIGERCTIAGAVAINGHIEIADGSRINGGSVITRSTRAGGAYASGTPMQEVEAWRRSAVRHTQLDALHRRVAALEKGRGP